MKGLSEIERLEKQLPERCPTCGARLFNGVCKSE
jgi:DNA-directed RNA polymerase subunit RPC12/RpoP